MNSELNLSIAKLRACVAFLGEKDQANWWSSSFLSRTGGVFLSPVFPKTAALARINGASSAARVLHDEHIGIGDVYHLFRLPENVEHEISLMFSKNASVLAFITTEESALACLQELSGDEPLHGIGPLFIELKVIEQSMIKLMAAAYLKGFSVNEQVYPYYRDKL